MVPVKISVIIACRNVEPYIDEAILSARRQTLDSVEILVVDDCSTDGTAARVERHAKDDARVRIITLPESRGPAGARNVALKMATGTFVAILDGDDYFHPERLERLLLDAETSRAEVVCDNLFVFQDNRAARNPRIFLPKAGSHNVSVDDFIRSNCLNGAIPALGYLKPLICRRFLSQNKIYYDETLPIGEDYHLLLEVLAAGGRIRFLSEPMYFYRRHDASTSHRLSETVLDRLIEADRIFCRVHARFAAKHHSAIQARHGSLIIGRDFVRLVGYIKRLELVLALEVLAKSPRCMKLLLKAAIEGISRRARRPRRLQKISQRRPTALIVSRQRVVGPVNGSSTYLLQLANALNANGFDVRFLSPSPVLMGRAPFIVLRPEMQVFASIKIRGCFRCGPVIIYPSLRTLVLALRSVLSVFLRRFGLSIPGLDPGPAPYAIAAEWRVEDMVFLARHGLADVVIADYAFQLPAVPYALNPGAETFVIMHDLFFRRAAQFVASGSADSVASLSEQDELRLLRLADHVVAIQKDEADYIARALPHSSVLIAPVGFHVGAKAFAGEDHSLLFVGSNTAPNVLGLNWFLETVWPDLIARRPATKLLVAGSVCKAIVPRESIVLLGVVPDLGVLYEQAGIVISPLTVGSGLKVKAVEAMAAGKAIVATSATLQGIEELVGRAVIKADDPDEFCSAISELVVDSARRLAFGEAALKVARNYFSANVASRDFVVAVRSAGLKSESDRQGAGPEAGNVS